MSRRKLRSVDYDREYVNTEDDTDIRRFVATMEELHLQLRDENWPAQLIDEQDAEKWKFELERYFREVGAPEGCSKAAAVDFVLSAVVEKLHNSQQNLSNLNSITFKQRAKELLEAQMDSQNPLNRIDYSSMEFIQHVKTLCSILGIDTSYPDAKELMKAACIFIIENLNEEVLENEGSSSWEKPKTMDIKDFPLGVPQSRIGSVNYAARVLRLTNLAQLRDVQLKINETLVEIQNITIDKMKKPDMKQVQYGKS